MANLNVGFLSASGRRAPHYDDFLRLVPPDVDLEIVPLGLWGGSLYDLAGKADEHIEITTKLAKEKAWEGIALMGAPMQVQNPEHIGKLRAVLDIPVTTALESGAAAVKAFGTTDILLLTPFDDGLNAMLRDFLAERGLNAAFPANARTDTRREDVQATERKTPEEVYQLAVDAFANAPGAQAVYFQGAPLNPLHILERLEADLGVPVVASNPAMFWSIASILGHSFSVPNAGRLLREWPSMKS